MPDLKLQINEAIAAIHKETPLKPQVGIIMGTGLGELGKNIKVETIVEYRDIPHFPLSTVESHAGRLLFGTLEGKTVVAMQGRFHYYEGYTMQQVTFPVRVLKFLGARILIVSNACGGLNPVYQRGDLMIIHDHINLQGDNPLIGPNDESIGPRFPDMCHCYDRELIIIAEKAALDLGIKLHKGVYVSVAGPNLETAAEYRFLRIIGADVVGMSTVPEVIVARHMEMRVLGFSIITDMGLPDSLKPTNLEEIIQVANESEPLLKKLMTETVKRLKI